MKLQGAEEFLKLDPSIRHDDCDHTWDKVIGWMDEYASQVLNEYKEKLNNLLDQQRPEPLQNGDSVWQEGYIECFKDLEKEIKKL